MSEARQVFARASTPCALFACIRTGDKVVTAWTVLRFDSIETCTYTTCIYSPTATGYSRGWGACHLVNRAGEGRTIAGHVCGKAQSCTGPCHLHIMTIQFESFCMLVGRGFNSVMVAGLWTSQGDYPCSTVNTSTAMQHRVQSWADYAHLHSTMTEQRAHSGQ